MSRRFHIEFSNWVSCYVQSQGHHIIDRLEERDVERGSASRSSLKGPESAIVIQTNTGTVSEATLGKLLRDGVERIWAFPGAQIPSWTELNWVSWVTINRIGCTEQFTVVVHQLQAAVSMRFGKRGTISCRWRTRSKRPLVTDRPAVHFTMSYSSSPSNRHSRIALRWLSAVYGTLKSRN